MANDVNAAAFGEYCVMNDKNVKSLVMMTLGTGIGGGLIYDGKIVSSSTHLRITPFLPTRCFWPIISLRFSGLKRYANGFLRIIYNFVRKKFCCLFWFEYDMNSI